MEEDHLPRASQAGAASNNDRQSSTPRHEEGEEEDNNDTSMANNAAQERGGAEEDVLYYVDADGNRIDPHDMHDYSVNQEEAVVVEAESLERASHAQDESIVMPEMDVDHPTTTQQNGSTAQGKANPSSISKSEQHDQPTQHAPGKQQEEEDAQQNEEDRIRFERPYKPPVSMSSNGPYSNNANAAEDAGRAPNYASRWTITGHRKNVSCIQFSPNGEWLITAGADGRVLLYALPQSPNLRTSTTASPLFIRSYSIPAPPVIKINISKTKPGTVVGSSNGINDLCFSPDSRYFATASDDKIVRIWKVDPFPEEGAGESGGLDGLDESMKAFVDLRDDPAGGAGGMDADPSMNGINTNGGVRQQEAEEEEEPQYIGHTNTGEPVHPSSSLSNAHHKPILLKGHTSFVSCVAFTPQGNLLASGSYDETIRIWDVKRGTLLRSLPAHADPVSAVGFSGDGSVLCSAGHDGLLRLWDTATGQCLKSLVDESNPPASHAVFTPNSRYILVSSLDSTIRLWDYHAAVCVKTYTGHKNVKYSIPAIFAQPPKGKSGPTYIVTGSEDGRVIFYDLQSRNIAFDIPGHKESPMLCLAYHQQSGMLATCALERGVKEHTVKLWIDKNRYPKKPITQNGQVNGH